MTKPQGSEFVKLPIKDNAGIRARIEMLGLMNEAYNEALGNQDRKSLRAIAKQYEEIGCPRLAEEIRTQARRRRVAHTTRDVDARSTAVPTEMAVTP